ncbi:21639_t:CDS:2, partial [Cetraspora pellucida]
EVHIDEELYERIKKEYEEDAHFQKILKVLEDPSCDEVKRKFMVVPYKKIQNMNAPVERTT